MNEVTLEELYEGTLEAVRNEDDIHANKFVGMLAQVLELDADELRERFNNAAHDETENEELLDELQIIGKLKTMLPPNVQAVRELVIPEHPTTFGL